jgi:hypothetical protein
MSEQAMEQAPAPSVEERIGNLMFGAPKAPKAPPKSPVEAQEAPEQEEAAPEQIEETEESNDGDTIKTAEEIFELEVDGETFALPKKLEKAVLSSREFTQKSQKVADRERAFEVLHEQARIANFRQQFEQENAADLNQLRAYDSVLEQPVDWNSMSTDEAFRRKLQLDQWKAEREAIARKVNISHQQWTQKQEQAINELKAKADEAVVKRIPNWTKESWNTIRDHAKSDGYTEAELNDIVDPRHKITLWKAQQFDQLKAKATKTVTDVKTVKTTPSNPMNPQTKQYLNYRKVLAKTAPNSPQRRRAVEDRIADKFSR